MKKIKYYSSVIVFLVAWMIISEIYVLHMENFQSEFPYMTFYRPDKIEQDVMIKEISESAMKNSLRLFVVEHKIDSLSSKKINIYSTTDVSKELAKKSYVSAGTYNSVFLGEVEVSYRQLSEITNIDDFSYYYYIGEKENAIKLKKELIDKYGGKFPRDGYVTQNYRKSIVVVWGIAFSFLLFLSVYQTMLEKKLLAVRVLMGESLGVIILGKVLVDVFVWSSEFFVIQLLIGTYGNTYAGYEISYAIFLLFLLGGILIYIPLFKMNFLKNLKNTSDKGILTFSYVYKIVIIAIFIVLTVGCMRLIHSGIDYYKQKDFFLQHKNYVYNKIELEDSEETNRVRFEFYNRCLGEEKVITLNQIESYSDSSIYIYADRGAIPYLKERIPELFKTHLDNKIYFLLPQGKDVKDVQETWESYYRGFYESEIIYYTSDDKIVSTYRQDSTNINSSREQSPSIILNNAELKDIDLVNPYLIDNSMYNISEREWNEYLEEKKANKNLSCLSNAYENYEKYWKQIQRLLILGIGIFVLLMLLEIIINNAILYYEYQMNAIEIIIKKITGYSFFSRYRKMLLITLLGDVLGIVLAICLLGDTQSIVYSLFGAIVLCAIEIIMLIRKTIHLELQQVNTMLKGGTL